MSELNKHYELYRKIRLLIDNLPDVQRQAACTALIAVALAELSPAAKVAINELLENAAKGK